MKYFQPEIETMPRTQLEALQLEKLKQTVAYCYNHSKFYYDKLTKAGVLTAIRSGGYQISNTYRSQPKTIFEITIRLA